MAKLRQSPDIDRSDYPNTKYYSATTDAIQSINETSSISSKSLDLDRCYPINITGKRGVCLLVNIYRKYSFLDVSPAKQIFEELNYEVRVFDNVTAQEYFESLKKIREEIELLKSDSFIQIFSSHSDSNSVVFADEQRKDRADFITEFSGDICPCLIGKPKLFFFQNCREQKDHISNTSDLGILETENFRIIHKSKPSYMLPVDVLQFHATIDGAVAYRDERGSVFLQSLYGILRDHNIRCLPFGEIELELRRRVIKATQSPFEIDKFQIPETLSTLTKIFYFFQPCE